VRDRIQINVYEKEKVFLWLPPKTGTHHAVEVFNHFDFKHIVSSYDKKTIHFTENRVIHNHTLDLFEGHENYEIICTARNPLKRVFSAFFYGDKLMGKKIELNKKSFIKFFSETIYDNDSVWLQGIFFKNRKPKYFLRTESLYEDYLKIPFVAESSFAKSGELESFCKIKLNSAERQEFKIQDFYTQDMVDYLYNRYKDYFDELGYEPKI